MTSTTLDGKYQVSSASSYEGPLEKKSDGVTEIRNGKTARMDGNGVFWSSEFIVKSETEVEMISIADPSEAKAGFALRHPNGSPTLEPVTYRATLKLARKGDKLQMSGPIEYGHEIVVLTLRKIGELDS